MEVDGPEVRALTVLMYEIGRSKSAKVNGSKISKDENRRSKITKVNHLKFSKGQCRY